MTADCYDAMQGVEEGSKLPHGMTEDPGKRLRVTVGYLHARRASRRAPGCRPAC